MLTFYTKQIQIKTKFTQTFKVFKVNTMTDIISTTKNTITLKMFRIIITLTIM